MLLEVLMVWTGVRVGTALRTVGQVTVLWGGERFMRKRHVLLTPRSSAMLAVGLATAGTGGQSSSWPVGQLATSRGCCG